MLVFLGILYCHNGCQRSAFASAGTRTARARVARTGAAMTFSQDCLPLFAFQGVMGGAANHDLELLLHDSLPPFCFYHSIYQDFCQV